MTMDPNTMAMLMTMSLMEMVFLSKKMDQNTMVNFAKGKNKDKALKFIVINQSIPATGRIMREMDRVKSFTRMVQHTMEIG